MPTTKRAPPQAASPYFSELKDTPRLFEMSQTCQCAVLMSMPWCGGDARVTWSLFPFSKHSSQAKHKALNVPCCLHSKLFLLSTLHSLSPPIAVASAKLKQKSSKMFLVFQETSYRDRENVADVRKQKIPPHPQCNPNSSCKHILETSALKTQLRPCCKIHARGRPYNLTRAYRFAVVGQSLPV